MKTENYSASVGKGEFIMNQHDEKMPPCDKLQSSIESMIVVIRGQQVILDRDLAILYGIETKRLKEQVNRNVKRFPQDFMFRLDQEELVCLRSQIATSKQRGGTRYAPYAFTENGVAMLSSVLHTEKAIATNIQIMRAFTTMRHVLSSNIQIRQRLIELEHRQIEADKRIDEVFQCLNQGVQVKEGIFYDGQIFDAYAFASELIKSAKRRIVLIDNYIDESVLLMLAKRNEGVLAEIVTKQLSETLALDLERHNRQYPPITIRESPRYHDRFLIVDDTVYHIGASLKDLGKKLFAFSRMEIDMREVAVLVPRTLPRVNKHSKPNGPP